MDQNELKSCHDLIDALTNPNIRPFLDINKILQSKIYVSAIKFAIKIALKHGNLALLNGLLAAVEDTPYAQSLILTVQSKLNVVVTNTTPPKFRKVMGFQMGVQTAKAPKEASAKQVKKASTKTPAGRENRDEQRLDLLDSRLMLPGSYGSGKRR